MVHTWAVGHFFVLEGRVVIKLNSWFSIGSKFVFDAGGKGVETKRTRRSGGGWFGGPNRRRERGFCAGGSEDEVVGG
jgi:hypothetical protein